MGINKFNTLLKMQNNQQKVKAYELRKQDESTLVQNLNKFRSELVGLRTQKVSSAPQVKLARIRVVRKAIAKTLTVLNEKRRTAQKEKWAKKRQTPKDLRAKLTKAARTGLSKSDKKKVTLRQSKKNKNFKTRKYGLPAN